MAGHSCIASEGAEGSTPIAGDCDDPAFSGGNMERPGLNRLMADVECGKVDIVAACKIDRLTRSLADFAKMVEVVERQVWDDVHAILSVRTRVRGNNTRSSVPYVLKGIVSGNDGRAPSPWYACNKNGSR